jgi:hypothetical protein
MDETELTDTAHVNDRQGVIDQAVRRLGHAHERARGGESESSHHYADEVLCQLLTRLGYSEVVEAYGKINKGYSIL